MRKPYAIVMKERIKAGLQRARAQGKRLGRARVADDVDRAVRASLTAGTGILKTARTLGSGTKTAQRIKAEMLTGSHSGPVSPREHRRLEMIEFRRRRSLLSTFPYAGGAGSASDSASTSSACRNGFGRNPKPFLAISSASGCDLANLLRGEERLEGSFCDPLLHAVTRVLDLQSDIRPLAEFGIWPAIGIRRHRRCRFR